MEKKLYIVTVHRKEDLEDLYLDLETLGGNEFIPEREIECSLRRPSSRNTHYYLTDEEAEALRQDPRIWDVQLPPTERGLTFQKFGYTQTGNFDKSNEPDSTSVNWSVYRNFIKSQISGWGYDDTPVQTATIEWNLTGKNVDIVLLDDTVYADHPDFTVNADGTGDSRFQSFNWFSLNSFVTAQGDLDGQTLPTGTYQYILDINESHGTSVASCAAGSNHGLAKSSNIYNIEFLQPKYASILGSTSGSVLTVSYVTGEPLKVGDEIKGPGISSSKTTIASFGTGTGGAGTYNLNRSVTTAQTNETFVSYYPGSWYLLVWDYIRAFHKNKPVNPETGKRNPTIVNCSFGLFAQPSISSISEVEYRGTIYNSSNYSPWTLAELYSAFGVPVPVGSSIAAIPARDTSEEADMQDAIDDGVFLVAAAGNYNNKIARSGDVDYNNRVRVSGTNYYYHQGGLFAINPNIVMVGSCNAASAMAKSTFSACGDRIDIFAAGENCAAAVNFTDEYFTIDRWEVQSNVVTFRIENPNNSTLLGELVGKEVEIAMAATVGFNGAHVVTSVSSEAPYTSNLFTINFVYPDTAQTAEGGNVLGYYTTRGRYPRDTRSDYTYISNVRGTSFSAPAVTGLLACLMEIYPRMDYDDAIMLISNRSAYGNMYTVSDPDYSEDENLRGAPNLILGYEIDSLFSPFPEERPPSGLVYPKTNYKGRFMQFVKNHSMAYPRIIGLR